MLHCDRIFRFKDPNFDIRHSEGIPNTVFLNERIGCVKNRDIVVKRELFVCGSFDKLQYRCFIIFIQLQVQ